MNLLNDNLKNFVRLFHTDRKLYKKFINHCLELDINFKDVNIEE